MLNSTQLAALKADILAASANDLAAARDIGNTQAMADWYNAASSFICWRKRVTTDEVGKTVSYVAVEAMTDADRGRITTFYAMNPVAFEPRADIRTYWANTFAGTLGGEGANTRAALDALWRRAATRGEALFATGTGTTLSPGTLVWEGLVSPYDVQLALLA